MVPVPSPEVALEGGHKVKVQANLQTVYLNLIGFPSQGQELSTARPLWLSIRWPEKRSWGHSWGTGKGTKRECVKERGETEPYSTFPPLPSAGLGNSYTWVTSLQ